MADLVAGGDDSPTATGWLGNQPGIHFFDIMPDDDILSLNDELRKLGSIIYCSGTVLEVAIDRHCAACFHYQRTTTWQRTVDGGIAINGTHIVARKAPHIDRRTSRCAPAKAWYLHIARRCPAASWCGGIGKGKAILRAVIVTTIPPPARQHTTGGREDFAAILRCHHAIFGPAAIHIAIFGRLEGDDLRIAVTTRRTNAVADAQVATPDLHPW